MPKQLTMVPVILLCLIASSAEAYVGPGLGMGAIGAILGLIGSVLLALLAFIWYPLKRFFRKIKSSRNHEEEKDTTGKSA
jgi:membrane associated rhomboid family serine protease